MTLRHIISTLYVRLDVSTMGDFQINIPIHVADSAASVIEIPKRLTVFLSKSKNINALSLGTFKCKPIRLSLVVKQFVHISFVFIYDLFQFGLHGRSCKILF